MRRDREFSSQEKESILMVDDDDNVSEFVDDDDEEDEDDDISSESTCCGDFKKETLKLHSNLQQQSADFEIWRLFQVDDQNMKDIPNADVILNKLTSTDIDGKQIERSQFSQINK